jgi:hypothetical protein
MTHAKPPTRQQLLAIETAFRGLAAAVNKRTSVGLLHELGELVDRIEQRCTTARDTAILGALPPRALAILGHQPEDFVRFVHCVYWIG